MENNFGHIKDEELFNDNNYLNYVNQAENDLSNTETKGAEILWDKNQKKV